MRTKFYLDKRTERKALQPDIVGEREYPVKIAINHGGSSVYLPTGVSVSPTHWQSKPGVGMVVGTAKADRLNIILSEKKLAVDKAIEELREDGRLHGASAPEIKHLVEKKLKLGSYGTDGGEVPISVCFGMAIKAKKMKKRTREVYEATLAKLRGWDCFDDRTTFRSVTLSWLIEFEAYLAEKMNSANARGIHLRNLRAVFNYALAEKLTAAEYPFRKFKIEKEPTEDRSLTPEELRALRGANCNPAVEKYRDLFFLSFFLCGMNLEDILEIKEIKGGRIEKRRIKTGQFLTIRVEPEALAIINKYKGEERLLSVTNGNNYRNFQHRLNDHLKQIGRTYNPHTKEWEGEALFPNISFYWARYSWATISADLDIPERTVGFAMGHGTSKSVTSIYMRVDMRKKIDAANRRVIDHCFGGGKSEINIE